MIHPRMQMFRPEHRLEDLPVDVMLALARCPIADADRARIEVPAKMRQLLLAPEHRAVQGIQHLETSGAPAVRDEDLGDPVEEFARVIEVAERRERLDGERRVPYPVEAVIPIILSSRNFRQRRRRGGRDALSACEDLEDESGTRDLFFPERKSHTALRFTLRTPAVPKVNGLLQAVKRRRDIFPLHVAVGADKGEIISFFQCHDGFCAMCPDGERTMSM